jgi:hypothetical protein
MQRKNHRRLIVTVLSILVIISLTVWLLFVVFEGEKPVVTAEPLSEFISGKQTIKVHASDSNRGLRNIKVLVKQGGREIVLKEEEYPFQGFFNINGIHEIDTEFTIDPSVVNLAQGRIDLEIRVRDYSRRSGGDGNLSMLEHEMTMDTIPPSVRALSRQNNVEVGGTGFVVYKASVDTVESGVYVNDLLFEGYPFDDTSESFKGIYVCYFAVPAVAKAQIRIFLWAKDRADNESRRSFSCHVRRRNFKADNINISDRFMDKVLPYFSYLPLVQGGSNIDKFLKINRELRKENNQAFYKLREKTGPERLWTGVWLRLKNAARMAGFGERRSYFYKGKLIDKQVHLGVDLASLANSKVRAANRGKVIFAGRRGIYGNTVVLDHGQGLASVYSHLDNIEVQMDQEVSKDTVLGVTGQTGLAGGDHLHFSVMVGGIFVNPIEWWDPHWIEDNISKKIGLLKK